MYRCSVVWILVQDDIFHTMKIVDILDLTKTVSLLSLEPFSPPLFLNMCKFLWKMSTRTIQLTKTITYANIANISETWSKNAYYLIHRGCTM